MAKIVIWVDLENFTRVQNGLPARGFIDQSTTENIQLVLPISAVTEDDFTSFIILGKQDW